MDSHQRAVIVGISGCSSSGKTTLARLLRDIFPNTFILHQDDFYKPEDQLPVRHGLVDWDCAEAISIPDMELALTHIRTTGTFPVSILSSPTLSCRRDHGMASFDPESDETPSPFPPLPLLLCPSSIPPTQYPLNLTRPACPAPQSTLTSKEDQNSVGVSPVTAARVAAAKARVLEWLQPPHAGSRIFPHPALLQPSAPPPLRLCLVDGFLLYATPHFDAVMASLDVKLFLLASRAKATRRREDRDGYVTLEGFWQDPPGYMDKIVWPNYAAAHAWLFEDGDAEAGRLHEPALEREGIRAQTGKGMDVDFGDTLDWAVDTIMKELEAIVLGKA